MSFALGIYSARRALRGDPKFFVIRSFGLAFGALGGTSFYKADLTDANFSHAQLKSTNFRAATLTRTCFKDALKLDRARPGDTILADLNVLKLLTTLNGYRQSYIDADLRGANLSGANLEGANFKWADLSGATLQAANLKAANLTETLCIDADFTHAYLTGACLQGWNIDHTTVLDHVDCQFVFLLEQANARGSRERRPHDPEKVFQPGDFARLYRKIMTTVQLLLRDGVNADAFRAAFERLMDDNPAISPDSIRSIEKVGNDVQVTLDVPEDADKGQIERTWDEVYTARLEAAKAAALLEAERRHADDLKAITLTTVSNLGSVLSNLTITNANTNTVDSQSHSQSDSLAKSASESLSTSHSESKAMTNSSDSSRNIKIGNVGGDFTASGAALNLGDISGTVTNALNQIPPTAAGNDLKAYLTELLEAIQTDPNLPAEEKPDAEEAVGAIATAAQSDEPEARQSVLARASRTLNRMAKTLPDATKFVQAVNRLLPLIAGLLGL
ncbi:MAG: pentapeptide repeat-containing protein [Synechococcales bacterium]|nr:pentapeptide repeat-containing protein [Synechococcales bacterium]